MIVSFKYFVASRINKPHPHPSTKNIRFLRGYSIPELAAAANGGWYHGHKSELVLQSADHIHWHTIFNFGNTGVPWLLSPSDPPDSRGNFKGAELELWKFDDKIISTSPQYLYRKCVGATNKNFNIHHQQIIFIVILSYYQQNIAAIALFLQKKRTRIAYWLWMTSFPQLFRFRWIKW